MKIEFEANVLATVLKEVERIIPASAKTNIHRFVRITANKEEARVDFETTSHESSIRRTLYEAPVQSPLVIRESGACLLPARYFLEQVKCTDGKVELISGKDSKVTLRDDFGKTNIPSIPVDQFTPYQNSEETVSHIEVKALQLRMLLEQTTYACAKSEARPIFTGVNFHFEEGKLHAVSTDTLRLASMSVIGEAKGDAKGQLTIPRTSLDSIAGILPNDDDETVYLEFGDTGLVVTWGDDETRCVMRAIDGIYPNVSSIIPRTVKHNLRVNRSELLRTFERIMLIAGENENMTMHVTFETTKILLSASAVVTGDGSYEVVLLEPNNENIDAMLFNAKYWLEMLKAFKSEVVEIGINGTEMLVTVRPPENEYFALVAPLVKTATESGQSKQSA